MISISLCMIVKNEEQVLKRCLDSIYDLVDEIIIVDTGSSDKTKEIALNYTDKIYDFKWVDDFSEARNYSFSKCTKEYIYVADADEYLTEENRLQFKLLKENMYPEIEIVQMMYETISHDTVLNIYKEYRPKLYKRLREFIWIDPIHETVRLDPLVFDSDIVVTHAPKEDHSLRDFTLFEKAIERDGGLSASVSHMYATELYKCGDISNLKKAIPYFQAINMSDDDFTNAYSTAILSRSYRISNLDTFEEYTKNAISKGFNHISELFYELGEYYLSKCNYKDASSSFHSAVYECSPILDIHAGGDTALSKLIGACEKVIIDYEEYKASNKADSQMEDLISEYRSLLTKYKYDFKTWVPPIESPQ